MRKLPCLVVLLALAAATGCDLGDIGSTGGGDDNNTSAETSASATTTSSSSTPPATSEAPPPISVDGSDQLPLGAAVLLGPHAGVNPANAAVTRQLYAASISDGLVSFSVDNLGWPTISSPVNGVNARAYIYWVDGGTLYGGHFDWMRPGQNVKTLANASNGYLGRAPVRGQPVWFCIVKADGKERTNVVRSQNNW